MTISEQPPNLPAGSDPPPMTPPAPPDTPYGDPAPTSGVPSPASPALPAPGQVQGDPAPTSGAPSPAVPFSGPPQMPPVVPEPAKGSRWTKVLAIITALFVVLTATMTGLYVAERNKLAKANATIVTANSDNADLKKKVEETEKSLNDSKRSLQDSEDANEILRRCVKEVNEFFDAVERGQEPADKVVIEAFAACQAAAPHVK